MQWRLQTEKISPEKSKDWEETIDKFNNNILPGMIVLQGGVIHEFNSAIM